MERLCVRKWREKITNAGTPNRFSESELLGKYIRQEGVGGSEN